MHCGDKRAYLTKKDARTALNAALRLRGRRGRAEQLRIYPCPRCRSWHLTKQADD